MELSKYVRTGGNTDCHKMLMKFQGYKNIWYSSQAVDSSFTLGHGLNLMLHIWSQIFWHVQFKVLSSCSTFCHNSVSNKALTATSSGKMALTKIQSINWTVFTAYKASLCLKYKP